MAELDDYGENQQQAIIQQTVMNELFHDCSPPSKYKASFLKYLIDKIERKGTEVSEDIYNMYIQLSMTKESPHTRFRTFFIDEERYVTIQESVNLISGGTTGMSTWQAAKYLAEWIIERRELLANKRVLELGSGVGLSGLVACCCAHPAMYTFTDVHPQVLELLHSNVNLYNKRLHAQIASSGNVIQTKKSCTHYMDLHKNQRAEDQDSKIENQSSGRNPQTDCDVTSKCQRLQCKDIPINESVRILLENLEGIAPVLLDLQENGRHSSNTKLHTAATNLHILQLDWLDVDDESLKQLAQHYDVITAADVVFDPDLLPSLVHVLHVMLRNGVSSAYVASTVRNQQTYDAFLSHLSSADLSFEEIKEEPSNLFEYSDPKFEVKLLQIRAIES